MRAVLLGLAAFFSWLFVINSFTIFIIVEKSLDAIMQAVGAELPPDDEKKG